MTDMISKIVDMDRQAREMTDKAKQQRENSAAQIEQSKAELIRTRMQQADEKLSSLRVQEEQFSEQRWQEFSEKSDRIVKKLEQSYKDNGEQWVDEIVNRVMKS